ncbi:retinoic acid early transcript 1E-like [Erinaceus europaeus]|uniref:Retinoic acid early transcript 1E-like n=1 Tax=Erinaceus europaeus TaxID=9365 RepID=A0ABM3YJU2_ERIEU|nr:retinoic acid early transcript 1E-like [Erinaceus europaeus]XP_060061327.1 retinoic acid early transcript 1E-like [Erinaceus europaeus]XP_060061328.1 retinoic acid early transcript 1E-like [Erinaceus europaeus]XP_060061329.1 retinoic acid early transcript 1E-like [Erinaceus europaeus]
MAVFTAGLGLILLLLEARETLGGPHSLCLNLTVRSEASPGQPWYEAQGSVDERTFLQYDNNKKTTPVGMLGEKFKDTKSWKELTRIIEETGYELRSIMSDTILKGRAHKSSPKLKANMCCQRSAGECTGALWEFNINGQTALVNTMTMNWSVLEPGAIGIKEEWVANHRVASYFKNISNEECQFWLQEFLNNFEEYLDSIAASSKAEETIQHYPSTWLITWIMPIITVLSYLKFA